MRVLITGGYGFFGAWIAKNLIADGHQVYSYDLKEDPRRLHLIMSQAEVDQVKFVQGDVTNPESLTNAVKANGISHIIHLAGLQVPTCRANPMLGATVNVLGTLAVFEAAKAVSDQVQRVVYASSAAVFGPPEKYPAGAQPNDAPLIPSTHYGVFKCCNEGNARIYFQDNGISSVGLRPWTVYGPGRDLGMTSEPTKAIKAALLGLPYAINFGGITDFQYADDVAKTFVYACARPFAGAKSYNMRGQIVSMQQFFDALCQVLPQAKDLVSFGSTQIAIAYDLADDELQRDLGPMPSTPLVDGIRQTVTIFEELKKQGRLDTADLDQATSPPVVTTDEV